MVTPASASHPPAVSRTLSPARLRHVLFWTFVAAALAWGMLAFNRGTPAAPLADMPLAAGDHVGIYVAPKPISLAEIVSAPHPAALFTPFADDPAALTGNERVHVWLRLPLHNSGTETRRHVIEATQSWIDLAQLHVPRADGGFDTYQNRPGADPRVKSIPFTVPAFPVTLAPGETRICYLTLQDEKWVSPGITFWPTLDGFLINLRRDDRFIHTYAGLMIGLFVANLCVFVAFRHRDLLYYLLYLLASCVLNAINFGIYPSYAESLSWLDFATPGSESGFTVFHGMLLITAALLLLFSGEFLNVAARRPRLGAVLHRIVQTLLVLGPLVMFGPAGLLGDGLRVPVTLLWSAATLLVLALGIDAALARLPAARTLLPAVALLGLTACRYTAATLAGTPVDTAVLHQWLFASCLEMIILAYGLVDRFLAVNRAREQAQARAVTEMTRRETLQREFNATLARTVDERTAELNAANRQKERFIAFLAHDIRTPLNALVSVASLISRSPQDFSSTDVQHYANEIEANARGVSELMENLLAWARIQNDQIGVDRQDYLVDDLFESVARSVKTQADLKRLQLSWNAPRNTYLSCDYTCIEAVLRNLVCNAIKFVPEGGRIAVHAAERDGRVRLEVSDNGVGITADDVARIRGLTPLPSQLGLGGEHGAGLGLSICFDFLRRHDSRLEVESVRGEGTRFAFSLVASEFKGFSASPFTAPA